MPRVITVKFSGDYANLSRRVTDPCELTVGRLPDNDIVVRSEAVSRRQGKLQFVNDGHGELQVQFLDADSKNGNTRNRKRFTGSSGWLAHGDSIGMSDVKFRVLFETQDPVRAARSAANQADGSVMAVEAESSVA